MGVEQYYNYADKYPVLSGEEQEELHSRFARGDRDALDKLASSNLRTVYGIVTSFANTYSADYAMVESMVEAGTFALLRAIEKYDPGRERGARLNTYVTVCVTNAVINSAKSHMRTRADKPLSLDMKQYGKNPMWALMEDEKAVNPEYETITGDSISLLRYFMGRLPETDQEILRKRYGLDVHEEMTFKEIGREIGVSDETTRKRETKARGKLREMFSLEEITQNNNKQRSQRAGMR
ncbi:MAG: sigma-70 family RNA polymerase sigma factor [Candidatus Aenigmarchaeota archaeon]|nr:sigma-70 family RNA polymerase sigma factor [Candidatus Aenigmarchaeota archaeon]